VLPPVVFFYYNRPDKLLKVLEQAAKFNFPKIYSFCDGPKNKEDEKKVIKCRELMSSFYPLGVHKHYKKNEGYLFRFINDLKEVFKYEEKAIIIEDDVFFDEQFIFASDFILNEFKDDKSIFCFKGYNNLIDISEDTYIKTKLFLPPWGWACWKRSIESIIDFSDYNKVLIKAGLEKIKKKCINKTFIQYIDDCKDVKSFTWDNHLFLTILLKNLNILMPGKNLITNIGYGIDSAGAWNTTIKYSNNKIEQGFDYQTKKIKDLNYLNEDNFADVIITHETRINGIPARFVPL